QINAIKVGYPGKKVIDGLTLPHFQSGEVTVLIGPNGAGKSTLLRGIAGLLKISGSVMYDGVDLTSLSAQRRAAFVSFMPQTVPTDINLSVIEAVISALKASPMDAAAANNSALHE